ncbi:MAG: IMP dehydrogenase [Calditrichaeota bacterium]|nr:IMP dehydrogenase [Calditrichota bacterium]MCB9368233.1 IMP dehydrogenase [Calditrichota bacterium]
MKTHFPRIVGIGLTYDDVLLIPAASEILPSEVDLSSRLTTNIKLKIPLVSAAMDTVSESELCIALARQGGIGAIHKNMSAEEQAAEVDRVKRSESAIIHEPYTLPPVAKLADALRLKHAKGVSGIPIIEDDGTLIGIITDRDMRFETNQDTPVTKLMTPKEKLITAPLATDLNKAEQILQEHRIEKLLLVNEKGGLEGLVTVKDIQKRSQFPNACKDNEGRLRVAAALGIGADSDERAELLVKSGVDALVVDSAHGHSSNVIKAVERLRAKHHKVEIIAGNVVTAEGARALALAGANAIKVGVGPGSICTTRVVAGVGVPQITAIMWVVEALADLDIPVIADGGIRYSGDIAKALGAGASAVMIGSLFAGTEEAPGETILVDGRSYKLFRGMGSIGAMKKGSADRYFQSAAAASSKFVPEGIEGKVPYKGKLSDTVFQLMGGIRASMGYCGAKTIHDMQTKTRFVEATAAGYTESHPHDVSIVQESPNYSRPK